MVASAVLLLIHIAIILGVAWAICWILGKFAPAVPAQVQSFIWLIAALVCVYALVVWAGVF